MKVSPAKSERIAGGIGNCPMLNRSKEAQTEAAVPTKRKRKLELVADRRTPPQQVLNCSI